MQQIPDHHRGSSLKPVQDYVVARHTDKVALHLETDEPRMRHASSETQHRGARSATDIKD